MNYLLALQNIRLIDTFIDTITNTYENIRTNIENIKFTLKNHRDLVDFFSFAHFV